MSVRQDNENKNCRNRGLGIAAAAIGVGVGAALYYFFSKRQEPDTDGATTSGWNCEPHSLSDSSFNTISEDTTTDTSMNVNSDEMNTSLNFTASSISSLESAELNISSLGSDNSSSESAELNISSSSSESHNSSVESDNSSVESDVASSESDVASSELNVASSESDVASSESDISLTEFEISSDSYPEFDMSMTELANSMLEQYDRSIFSSISSIDSETGTEWDVTNSSVDVPSENRRGLSTRTVLFLNAVMSGGRLRRRKSKHRDRTWAPEECAICFDMMNTQQNVMSLPCTHRFHQDCILCWLQEKQTCPVCRKLA